MGTLPKNRKSSRWLGLGLGALGSAFIATQMGGILYLGHLFFSLKVSRDPTLGQRPLSMDEVKQDIEEKGSLEEGLKRVMSSNRSPSSIETAASQQVDRYLDEESELRAELGRKILAQGDAYFQTMEDPISGREEALNVARSLTMDPSRKFSKEATELSRLVLLQPVELSGSEMTGTVDLARGFAAAEWALGMFLDQNSDQNEAVQTAIDIISSQKNAGARERLRLVFLQKYKDKEMELNRALGSGN